MQHYEFNWMTSDGNTIYGQGWQPEQVRAVVCLVHGIGEHSGRYVHVADALTRAGYALISFDLRGHGKSSGQRGHLRAMDDFMDDIDQLFAQAERRYPGVPRVLYGHSLGGLLVLNHVLRRNPAILGVIASAPGLRTALREQKVKVAFNYILAGAFANLTVPTGLDSNMISRDPDIVRSYESDPLVHGLATLSMAREGFNTIDWVMAHVAELTLPLLLLHGTADRLVYVSGSEEVARLVPNTTLKLYEGLYHEVHNEPEKERVLADLIAWIDSLMSNG